MFGWCGTITGIIGATLIALNFEFSRFGYLFFLISSITWGIQAFKNKDKALIIVNIAFIVVNIVGVIRWFKLL